MVSKYVRERLMEEFNRFWRERTPGLKPTAGYPGDAKRFYDAIRPTAEKAGHRGGGVVAAEIIECSRFMTACHII